MAAYGGTTFPEEFVRSMEHQVESATLGLHHDPRRRLDARLVATSLERDADGYLQLVLTYEVDEDAWLAGGGGTTTGFSFTGYVRFLGLDELDPRVSIAADAHWFSDAQLKQAFDSLKRAHDSVSAFRLYQFAAEPEALVTLNFVLSQLVAIGPGVAASWIYDALKNFLGTKPSTFSIEVSDATTGKTARAYLRTSSPRLLRHAMDTLPDVLLNGGSHEYSERDETWHQSGSADESPES